MANRTINTRRYGKQTTQRKRRTNGKPVKVTEEMRAAWAREKKGRA